jgi:NADPH:quinone reductase
MLMTALQFDQTGSLDALALREVTIPVLGDGDVLVKIHASGINPSDIKNVLGRFPYTTVPRIPGRDFSGVVIEGPSEWKGKSVWGSGKGVGFTRDGAHAEYLAFPVAGLSLKPDALSFAEAAAVGVPYITAMEALDRSGVKKDTRLLIIGAAGAVGSAAIALAKQRGAQIVGAVRKPAQQIALQAQGIDSILLTDGASLAGSMQQYFPEGAEAIFDTTGFWLADAVSALRLYGTVAVIAAPVAKVAEFPLLDFYRRGSNLVGINSLLHDLPTSARMLDQLRTMFDAGMAKPGNLLECALGNGVQVYRDVDSGCSEKCVFVM